MNICDGDDVGVENTSKARRSAIRQAIGSVGLEGFAPLPAQADLFDHYIGEKISWRELSDHTFALLWMLKDEGGLTRDIAEGALTCLRLVELSIQPAVGKFDVDHLCEINRRIFQDFPSFGFADVTPGMFREPVADGHDWIKKRAMDGLPLAVVAYSPMNHLAREKLGATLRHVDPSAMGNSGLSHFITKLAMLYNILDYLHPFPDGNSRTLRAFTRQLAQVSGFDVDWARFHNRGRYTLYVARDLNVNEIALPLVQNETTRREIVFMLDQFGGNRNLSQLLQDAVSRLG